MDLLFLLLSVFDGLVVGIFVFFLIAFLLGDKPLARLFKVLLGVGGGIAYSLLCLYLGYGEVNISIAMFLIIILAPVALAGILWLISYMFDTE